MVGETYYQIRPKSQPEVYGTVVKFVEGKLEVFAGDSTIEELNLTLKEGSDIPFLCPKADYATKISRRKAYELRGSFEDWKGMQALTGGSVFTVTERVGFFRK